MHTGILPACISVYHVGAWCPQKLEEGIKSLGIGVMDSCETPRGYWEWSLSPLEEQIMLLSAGLYL